MRQSLDKYLNLSDVSNAVRDEALPSTWNGTFFDNPVREDLKVSLS